MSPSNTFLIMRPRLNRGHTRVNSRRFQFRYRTPVRRHAPCLINLDRWFTEDVSLRLEAETGGLGCRHAAMHHRAVIGMGVVGLRPLGAHLTQHRWGQGAWGYRAMVRSSLVLLPGPHPRILVPQIQCSPCDSHHSLFDSASLPVWALRLQSLMVNCSAV